MKDSKVGYVVKLRKPYGLINIGSLGRHDVGLNGETPVAFPMDRAEALTRVYQSTYKLIELPESSEQVEALEEVIARVTKERDSLVKERDGLIEVVTVLREKLNPPDPDPVYVPPRNEMEIPNRDFTPIMPEVNDKATAPVKTVKRPRGRPRKGGKA